MRSVLSFLPWLLDRDSKMHCSIRYRCIGDSQPIPNLMVSSSSTEVLRYSLSLLIQALNSSLKVQVLEFFRSLPVSRKKGDHWPSCQLAVDRSYPRMVPQGSRRELTFRKSNLRAGALSGDTLSPRSGIINVRQAVKLRHPDNFFQGC